MVENGVEVTVVDVLQEFSKRFGILHETETWVFDGPWHLVDGAAPDEVTSHCIHLVGEIHSFLEFSIRHDIC